MKLLPSRSRVVLLVFFTILVYEPAWGEDWKTFGSDRDAIHFYDKDVISHPSTEIVRVSVKVVFTPARVSDLVNSYGKGYRALHHKISIFELNCKYKMIRMLSSTWYWTDGREITPYLTPNDKWYSIIPELSEEDLQNEVCK